MLLVQSSNPNFYSDCDAQYETIQQLIDNQDVIPAYCMEQYLVNVEVAIMTAALEEYQKLLNGGYDKKFKIYEDYVAAQVPDQIDAFMASGKADQYFKCSESKKVYCCSDCRYITCNKNCDNSKNCKTGKGSFDITCPTNLKDGHEVSIGEYVPNTTFSVRDPDGFWKDIGEKYGIEKAWVKFGRKHIRTNNGCQYSGKDIQKCIDETDDWWYGYPVVDTVKVYNPKDLIGQSYDKTKELLGRLEIMRDNVEFDELMLWSDVIDASSLPALTIQTAIDSMKQIVKAANEIKKKEREELILGFITGFLFFIPIVGEAAGSAGMATARSLLHLVGAAGEAGLMVYDIIEDPNNAFMSVFSYLAGAGVGRSGFKKAADARRSMKSSDIEKLGTVKQGLYRIQALRGNACVL